MIIEIFIYLSTSNIIFLFFVLLKYNKVKSVGEDGKLPHSHAILSQLERYEIVIIEIGECKLPINSLKDSY